MVELAGAVGVESRRAADGPQVCGEGGVMSDSGGADGPREPGVAECPMVLAGVKGGRSAGVGAQATGRGGPERSEARGRATDSPCPGGGGSLLAQQ